MKLKLLAIVALSALNLFSSSLLSAQTRYVGGDISLLDTYEEAGAKYKDSTGKPIADLIPWCYDQGMNAMRVRVFVNPEAYRLKHENDTDSETRYDPNACQDIQSVIPLCQRIVESGMKLMLDFHYSDTWADPAKQWTPIDWEGLTDEQLYQKIYDYTKESLLTLKDNGVTPTFIQTGNEISYGMLWGELGTSNPKKTFSGSNNNWERLGTLLKKAGEACREVCPDAKIVLHTERVADLNTLRNFYNRMKTLEVEYEIIGLSYYPYFHGDLNQLSQALQTLQSGFPEKEIMIVETGYAYKWEVPGTIHDFSDIWSYSNAGQNKFATELVATLKEYEHVNGLFWWWMEYNAFSTSLSNWYNAPLFDSLTGKVTPALKTLCSFASESGIAPLLPSSQTESPRWYDLQGRPLPSTPTAPGLYLKNGKKILH